MKVTVVQKAAIKAAIGVGLTVAGTVLGFFGVRDLCFEKHEIGDLIVDGVEEAEEEVL
ncbi:MAG: hypothetical protein ACI4RS_02810 [Monoglobaceae bacterium]